MAVSPTNQDVPSDNDGGSSVADSHLSEDKSISLEQMDELEAWIRVSEDPVPTLQDVENKVQELFGKELDWGRSRVERFLHTRTLNGPAKRDDRLMVPGYGLPLTHRIDRDEERLPFLFGLMERDWKARTLTNREVCMLRFVEDITNKREWWLKVRNPDIVSKWRQEVLKMPWSNYQSNADFTGKMADACFIELKEKAKIYEQTGLIPVMDYTACVIKSDTLLTTELREALKAAVVSLEDVPESCKDWHPGSDGKVIDLVHPSLWPLMYGKSRIVPDERIPIDKCLDYCGRGTIIPEPIKPNLHVLSNWRPSWESNAENRAISTRFQWLPCDVDLTGERPRIDSYINNLHPTRHAHLYPIIERFIEKSLPAWDIVIRSLQDEFPVKRLKPINSVDYVCGVPEICEPKGWCTSSSRPGREDEDNEESEYDREAEDEMHKLDEEWWNETHKVILPEPNTDVDDLVPMKASDVPKKDFFNNASASRIQIIVKLANIHLTPEKPTYDGGSWHVEGQVNDHICATALYYYDCDNVKKSRLAFRTVANEDDLKDELNHEQDDFRGIEKIFALEAWRTTLQKIGSVLTREGRALFFPNVYQHQVQPFELSDKTRPGHRKILALFLVDPYIPVLSTANIPPQRIDWWAEHVGDLPLMNTLPSEIKDIVNESVDFPISLDEAKKIREELMEERRAVTHDAEGRMIQEEWTFCEH